MGAWSPRGGARTGSYAILRTGGRTRFPSVWATPSWSKTAGTRPGPTNRPTSRRSPFPSETVNGRNGVRCLWAWIVWSKVSPRTGLVPLRQVSGSYATGHSQPASSSCQTKREHPEACDILYQTCFGYNPFSFDRVPRIRPEQGTGGRGRSPKGSRSPAPHPSAPPASLGMPMAPLRRGNE
jgi:hypothetical protein